MKGAQPVISVRCHPALREWARSTFDGFLIFDPSLDPEIVQVVPLAYAKNISVTIGFVNQRKPRVTDIKVRKLQHRVLFGLRLSRLGTRSTMLG